MGHQIDRARHVERPWRVHALAADFTLLDVWEIPLSPSPGATFVDFHRAALQLGAGGGAMGLLMRVRERIGRRLHWDEGPALPIPGCRETSVAARLTDEDRRRVISDGGALPDEVVALGMRPVYLFDDESLEEVSNKTIHALLHMAWMGGEPPTVRLAVYVKYRGLASRLYMAAIQPFRHALVYPSWIRQLERAWDARARS
jgi:hypothetical protein